MKKRSLMIGSVILLVILLIGGGTFAWFTYSTRPVVNNFKAGTLRYSVYECFDRDRALNVNPGDCIDKWVIFKNMGTKRMFVRVQVTPAFEGGLPTDGVVSTNMSTAWKLRGGYYYYPHEIAPGETIRLFDKVCFSGPNMTNLYQGKTFSLTIASEAIQVTNDAPEALWGFDPLTLRPVSLSAEVGGDISPDVLAALPEGLEFIEIGE